MFDADELDSQPIHGEPDVADPNSVVHGDVMGTHDSQEESEGEEGQIMAAPAPKKHHPGNPYRPVVVAPCCMPVPATSS